MTDETTNAVTANRQVEILCERPVEFKIGTKTLTMKPKGFDMAFWLQDKVIDVARAAEINVRKILETKDINSQWDVYRKMSESARPQLRMLIPLMFEDEIPGSDTKLALTDKEVGQFVTMTQAAEMFKTFWKQNDLGEVLKNVRGPRT